MTESSVNIHYHGTNTSPSCHSDEVIHTVINSGHTFTYNVQIPADEPPGLYWYHPHIHGNIEAALQGGGSGAIVVEGIEDFQHAVAAMRQMILVVRDQNVAGDPLPGGNVPSWDLTLNNILIAYPAKIPAVLQMHPGERQLWRVSNSSADSIIDLQVRYDGTTQKLQIVGLDGVPTGSQDGTGRGEDREIAEHVDDGMMAIVRVVPAIASARLAFAPKASIGAGLRRNENSRAIG